MGKFLSFKEAKKRFEEQGRTDIRLCEDGFLGWSKKSKFLDLILKQEFWSIPKDVYSLRSSPLRRKENAKQTNLEKYGFEHPLQSKIVKEKQKQTNLERYGVENPLQSKKIQEKYKETNLERYGVENPSQSEKIKEKKKQSNQEKYNTENPFQSEKIKNKIKETNLERYGVENPSQSEKIKEKKKQTNLRKYGVEYPIQSEKIKNKIKETNLERYGVEYYTQTDFFKKNIKEQLSYRLVKETGERLKDWFVKQIEPKPSFSSIVQNFTENQISLVDLEEYFKNYKDHKTNLEVFTENLFGIKHFNRKPEKINLLYRPDFKLNDQIYLNVDGLYWHIEEQKGKHYHFNLRKEFEENGLQIFQFYENELLEKTDIIKSIIDNVTKKIPTKIFARKCQIKSVPHKEAQIFLNQSHLMGSTTAKHIGLYYQNELVSILSYKHKKQKIVCNIERFCSKINTNVVGAFSKLLKYLESNCLEPDCQEIHNWVDLRYGTGKHLFNKGFELKKETLGWRWTDCKTTYNRLKCRANMDERKLTQQQHADELNWHKIYDAGQRLYIRNLTPSNFHS